MILVKALSSSMQARVGRMSEKKHIDDAYRAEQKVISDWWRDGGTGASQLTPANHRNVQASMTALSRSLSTLRFTLRL